MFTRTTQSTTRSRLAEAHARQMFTYYYLRALLETNGAVHADEQEAARYLAVESRRFGFRIEAQAESIGLILDSYDEESLRREAYRAAGLSESDPAQALSVERRAIEQAASAAAGARGERVEQPLAA
jgi:hypothetical protein